LESCDESRSAPFEILFVDDGSTDGSSDLLDRLAADYPRVRVLHFDRNYGQSSAFDAGFKYSTGDLVITIDGDLQNDPADIGTLLPHVKTFDLVCGWRTNRHDNLVRTVSSRIANAVRGAVTSDRVHDTGCSLKIFRRAVVDKLQLFNGMHRFFPALALMHGFTGHRSASAPLSPRARPVEIRCGEPPLQKPLRPDRRTLDANSSAAVYIPQQVTDRPDQ
jgi:Glycosyltransferases involved in cell wall biogenesis